jgi:hypothetical protein
VRTRAIVAAVGILVTGCSSSGPSGAASSSITTPTKSGQPSDANRAQVASYVAAVNALCQDLLPKILEVTNNGNPAGFTVAQFKEHVAAHAALERDFDRKFAAIPVPSDAQTANAAMRAYIAYANRLDARRLAAANRSQKAFVAEVRAEDAEYPTSGVKKGRDAAGFDAACDAR